MRTRAALVIGLSVLVACGGGLLLDETDGAAPDGTVTPRDAGSDATSGADGLAEADATTGCPNGQVLCGGVCYPNDVNHCGASCATCATPPLGGATCDGTSCGFTCNILQCGSTCVDPSSDPQNCGTCNHVCPNETCTAGECTPELVFPTVVPGDLTVDSTNLYWGTGSEVDEGPKAGGSWSAIAKNRNMVVALVAVDSTNVYWSEDYAIAMVPIGGGTVSTLPISATWPCLPGLGPQAIYTGDFDNSGPLLAVPYDAGTPIALEPSSTEITGTLYRAPYVYFSAWGPPSTLWRTNASVVDAGSELLFSHNTSSSGLPIFVMDDAGTAYAQMSDGVWAVPPDGGTPVNVANNAKGIEWIAVDASDVYMASQAAIYRTPIGGTTPVTLYTAPTQDIHAMTVDDTYVYYSYGGNNGPGIYRFGK